MPESSAEKAFLETEKGDRIPCLFNPAELKINRVNDWAADRQPGSDVPTLRYIGARSGFLRVNLFFDTTDSGEAVTTHTSKLLALMEPDASLAGADEATGNVRPPWVKFHWGDLHSFKAVVSSMDVTFVYFATNGTPLRARAELGLTQYDKELQFGRQNPTSGTPRPHRVHQVSPGETLDRIAARHYGDSTKWRLIADANGIEDPLALRPGRVLSIPTADGR